ncbi:Glutamate--cysteine ligase GshA [Slackia heliotrinireducens]|uniref:Glutamate--cysteine ligase n=1 Tax=Slackia heliotrinireducens (strain ATCC 29202 / DSM 20476 / NCTC 11029 / RHS 1) TaxID=471855 RepID=C7N311_SLAHD|nr:glutamate-cysteine ligase family protein [Slackia heliotrinireducens]ACV21532.1 gamma-glutamylcysteine synthetase [Slackia heliotrinireducens DSM 20476]VEG99005.1 Glutamate--cysteine ligase GshA [Slackia heliotrinireducens]
MERHPNTQALYADQPAREQNIQALVSLFESGIKKQAETLGVEVEHTIVDADGQPLTYSQPNGVADVLEALSATYPQVTKDGIHILGLARPKMNVTIEPAAQIELSAGPFVRLDEVEQAFVQFDNDVAQIIEPHGCRMLTYGYDTSMKAVDKELIPKARYDFMNRYLSTISPYGPRMMRGSASTQISIDFTSEADAVRKLRLSNVLAPIFALICDNTPVFEGKKAPHYMMRTEIWRHLDPVRCNTVPGSLAEDFSFRKYAEYVLGVPAIVAPNGEGGFRYDTRTFGEIYAEVPMERPDVEHALSMQWPDTRLKTYLEIRPADSMPTPYVVAYAGLVKGLFYSESSLNALDDMLCDVLDEALVEDAKTQLMRLGYDAQAYGMPVSDIADKVIELAYAALGSDEKRYLDPLAELVEKRITLTQLSDLW